MATRLLIDVPLRPASGTRFQPTGFPDIGTAEFDRPVTTVNGGHGWERAIVVESAQSVANRLEAMAWDDATDAPLELFSGLPYLRVMRAGTDTYLTSSRTEAHRIAAAFVKDSTLDGESMIEVINARLGLAHDSPISRQTVAHAVFGLDPFCLLHGVFLADKRWPGQPKIARAVTGFVEAHDVRRADSGGVKKDHVRHALGDEGGGTAEGYGSVPFHRTEWTAGELVASFCVDLRQLASYGLGADATDLLEAIALYEIRSFVENGMRLRTACDLVPTVDLGDLGVPPIAILEGRIRNGIAACAGLSAGGRPIEVQWSDGGKRAKK